MVFNTRVVETRSDTARE